MVLDKSVPHNVVDVLNRIVSHQVVRRHRTMKQKSPSPLWLKTGFIVTLLGAVGCFVAATIYGTLHPWPQDSTPPLLFVQCISGFCACFGLAFGLGIIHTIFAGGYYSGIARRIVRRDSDPLHFHGLLAVIGLLPLALIAYGVHIFLAA